MSVNGIDLKVNDLILTEEPQLLTLRDFIANNTISLPPGSQFHIILDHFNNPVNLKENAIIITTYDNNGAKIDEGDVLLNNGLLAAQI